MRYLRAPMSFVYPGFLFALAAISIPIIVHLFNFRRYRKVYFSDIRFLKNVEMQTRSRNQLRHLLILSARILAIACLVMAFAQPFIPKKGDRGNVASTQATIYVDNSFSMNAEGENGSLLDEAKAKALEVASAYANGSSLRLLTNDFDPRHQRSMSLDEFKAELAAVSTSASVRKTSEVSVRAQTADLNSGAHDIFLITDLQRSTTDLPEMPDDTLSILYILPVMASAISNLYVDSCWFPSPVRLPSQPDVLQVRVRNTGGRTVENLTVKLTINGMQRAIGNVTVQGSAFEDLELAFTNNEKGVQLAEITIEDYPITYDNRYLMSFVLAQSLHILHIKGEDAGDAVARLYGNDLYFIFKESEATRIDLSEFPKQNLIVVHGVANPSSGLAQELTRYCENGGHVLIIPAAKADRAAQNELLLSLGAEIFGAWDTSTVRVDRVNLESQLLRNVFMEWGERIDLPSTSGHFRTETVARIGREPILTLANGDAFLSRYPTGKGSTYVLTAPLKNNSTNFHRHALFVPALYNMALFSGQNSTSSETLGDDRLIPVTLTMDGKDDLTVVNVTTGERFKPELVVRGDGMGIYMHGQVRADGHHLLMNGTDTVQPLSFNYNRAESMLEHYSEKEYRQLADDAGLQRLEFVSASVGDVANTVSELQEGKRLWRLFLILALLFLAIETILVRLPQLR